MYRANNEWLLATPRGIAVLHGQFLLLRGLAALVCLVWGKAEPATCPSRTILHDALNGQTATSNPNSRQLHLTHVPHVDIVGHALYNIHGWRGGWVTKLYGCTLFIIDGLGHTTNNVVLNDASFSITNSVFLAKSPH